MSDKSPDETGGPPPPPEPRRRRRQDGDDMPFYEGEKIGDETPKIRRWGPTVVIVLVAALVAAGLLALALTQGGDDGGEAATTTRPPLTTTTVAPTTTSATATDTTVDDGVLEPGERCFPDDGNPDCIDIDGNGIYTYLIGGGECLETAEDPRHCVDTDGDGRPGPIVETS